MAATSLLALIDDIATVLDDVSAMTKVAARKTAGVLGDDLALNAQQVVGVRAERELPVVWAVALGSLKNKVILIPAALLISTWAAWAITPLLMLGGAYLCFEGAEKLAHKFLHSKDEEKRHAEELKQALLDPNRDLATLEREKIRGAVRTDFVLSAEIIVITLGVVAEAPLATQIGALVGIALVMTIGVYGLVAGIVKLDDLGLYLTRQDGESRRAVLQRRLGRGLLRAAPLLMRILAVVGTAAMFLVGGGILIHGIPGGHDLAHAVTHLAGTLPWIGAALEAAAVPILNGVVGVLAGILVLAGVQLAARLRPSSES